jgi:membrane carboxypeptidase/penicillin-binding protein
MEGPHAALADLVALLFRYRCLRVELNAEEAAILTVLKQAKSEMQPPLSEANIRDALKRERLILKRPLTEALASLKSKRTDRATLVLENGGRWAIGSV